MPADRFRPGHRNRPQARGDGKLSEGRAAWVKAAFGQLVLMVEAEPDHPNLGPSVMLTYPRPSGRPVTINLTALTEEELDAMQQFFDLLFQTARPVIRLRDKVAKDALAQGDDSHARVYRQAPQFVVRSREVIANAQGVWERLAGVPPLDEAPASSDGELRGDSDGLAEPTQDSSGPEDDGSEDQQPPVLG